LLGLPRSRRVRLDPGPHILNSCMATVTDGWCRRRRPLLGRFGAAGLLLRAPRPDGTPAVLLQHRAVWSHQGGTWSLPGGARDSHETAEETAFVSARRGRPDGRPAVGARRVVTAEVAGIGGMQWTYTTVVADAGELLHTVPTAKAPSCAGSAERGAELPLHPAFAPAAAPADLPGAGAMGEGDERRRRLPRTMEIEAGVRLVHAPATPSRAVAAEPPDQLTAASADLSCSAAAAGRRPP